MAARTRQPFPAALLELMAKRGVTFRALAASTGLSAGYLNRLATGDRPVPSTEILETLAVALRAGSARYFVEERLRVVVAALERDPGWVDRLYAKARP